MDRERAVYLGQPIVDAHLTEQCQDWIGAGVHHSCEKSPHWSYLGSVQCDGAGILYDCDIPLKPCAITTNRDVPRLALNWPLAVRLLSEQPTVQLVLNYEEVKARGKAHQAKWAHTIDFYRSHIQQVPVQPDR